MTAKGKCDYCGTPNPVTHEQYLVGLKEYEKQQQWARRRRVELGYTGAEIAKRLLMNVNTIRDYDKGRQGYDRRTGKPQRAFVIYCEQLEKLEPNTASRGGHRVPIRGYKRKRKKEGKQ